MRRFAISLFVFTILVVALGSFGNHLSNSLDSSVHANRNAVTDSDLVTASFAAPTYEVNEGAQKLDITVTLSAPAPNALTVDYATAPDVTLVRCDDVTGIASDRCDFTTTLGTLRFAVGEQSKTFSVFITDDSYVEGPETFNVSLSTPHRGASTHATADGYRHDQRQRFRSRCAEPGRFAEFLCPAALRGLSQSVGRTGWH